MRGVLRSGQVVARLAGDEFALLIPTHDTGERAVAEQAAIGARVLEALTEPFLVHEVRLAVEASAGIAVSGVHGSDAGVLLQRADIAMYQAKSTHQRLKAYDPTSDGHTPRKLALLAQLREAIGTEQLQLHYQPLVELATDRVSGAEALIRWQHPVEGMLSPAEFIPLAEGSGLIHDLTACVLDQACSQARRWQASGTPITVSVNVSARCLLDAALPDTVEAALARSGLAPERLNLEITESAIIADAARAQQVIDGLAALGVGLSIDDFGTGYTSLSYLRDLPVTELKIDRSFVTRMLSRPKDAVIVRTGIELADRLQMTSVAEGIEDEATRAALAELGCTTGQGYHLARPMPAATFAAWLDAHLAAANGPATRDPGAAELAAR